MTANQDISVCSDVRDEAKKSVNDTPDTKGKTFILWNTSTGKKHTYVLHLNFLKLVQK